MRARGRTARKFGVKASATFFSASFVVIAAFVSSTACSHHVISSTFGPATGDETTYGVALEGSALDPPDVRNDRLAPHAGIILANMHVRAVYIGTPGVDAAPNADPFLTWIGASDYWKILTQYGVSDATYDGASNLSTAVAFPNAMIENGLIPFAAMDARVRELVHGGDGGTPLLPAADAYAIFLPDNVNIDSGFISGEENITCVTSAAYHAHDGSEAYAVFPPCNDGRSTESISHELTEVATDPILKQGWMSDQGEDIKTGGEIADVCYRAALHQSGGFDVAELWSNAAGDCLPK